MDGDGVVFKKLSWGLWVALSVKHPTSAQVMISQFVSPMLCSVLTDWSLEPALDFVSPSLSAPPLLTLRLSKINIKKKRGPGLKRCINTMKNFNLHISEGKKHNHTVLKMIYMLGHF